MLIVANQPLTSDTADDRWIGNVLHDAGIQGSMDERYRVAKCDPTLVAGNKGNDREDCMVGNALHAGGLTGHADHRYVIAASPSGNNTVTATEAPMEGNDIIAACEFEPMEMHRVHSHWYLGTKAATKPSLPTGVLSDVSVLIKTFLRDGYMKVCVAGILKNLPEAKIIIVDDGDDSKEKIRLYSKLRAMGHVCIWLPKDSGFGAKANAALPHLDRKYLLIGSDDFNFEGPQVRSGIERMKTVLDVDAKVGVASGRVNNQSYEYLLDISGDCVKARQGVQGGNSAQGVSYHYTDLTVNYSLVRKEVFDGGVCWDSDVKIGGGEHGAFYIDVKKAGWKVAVVSGASIQELPDNPSWKHRDYDALRRRARNPERPCYIRRGVNHFITSTGCEMHGANCKGA